MSVMYFFCLRVISMAYPETMWRHCDHFWLSAIDSSVWQKNAQLKTEKASIQGFYLNIGLPFPHPDYCDGLHRKGTDDCEVF